MIKTSPEIWCLLKGPPLEKGECIWPTWGTAEGTYNYQENKLIFIVSYTMCVDALPMTNELGLLTCYTGWKAGGGLPLGHAEGHGRVHAERDGIHGSDGKCMSLVLSVCGDTGCIEFILCTLETICSPPPQSLWIDIKKGSLLCLLLWCQRQVVPTLLFGMGRT